MEYDNELIWYYKYFIDEMQMFIFAEIISMKIIFRYMAFIIYLT